SRRSSPAHCSASASGCVAVQAPQPTPTTSTLLSSSRFTLTVGISPPVKPITSSRPPGASERSESVNRSPPTGSTTTSTPRPLVNSFAASLNPAASTTSVAPAAVAISILSSVLTTAMIRDAPSTDANRSVDVPIPPAAEGQREEHSQVVEQRPRARRKADVVRQLEHPVGRQHRDFGHAAGEHR